MKFITLFTSVSSALFIFQTAQASLHEQDTAVLFPLEDKNHIRIRRDVDGRDLQLFKEQWLEDVSSAYEKTSVGDALKRENLQEDWKLISLRLVPCSPLGSFPNQAADDFCWPEIRQVWQPVLVDVFIIWNTVRRFYADDRAIHALYDIHGGESAKETQEVVAQVKRYLATPMGHASIPTQLKAKFLKLRDAAVESFIADVKALRSENLPSRSFKGLNVRAETHASKRENKLFKDRLSLFLNKNAPVEHLKTLTSFSLPEGRTPAATDEWVFISFKGDRGKLQQEELVVLDTGSASQIVNFGFSERATMRRDDAAPYDRIFEAPETENKLRSQVLLFENDREKLRDKIADRTQLMVANTSCASCHKYSEQAFDFHNFSYLEDWSISIAPRVLKDVEHDLRWYRQWVKSRSVK